MAEKGTEDKEDAFSYFMQKAQIVPNDSSHAFLAAQRKRPAKRRRLSVEHDDERTDYLSLVVTALNSNDEDAIQKLVFRLCTNDCIYMERYFEWLPVLPVYREMVGPQQIFNYLVTLYQCIPDALLKFIGSKLYERTNGTSYLIGRLKFNGIGFCNLQVAEEVHNSPRFLSKDSMFSAIYGPPIDVNSSSQTVARNLLQVSTNPIKKEMENKLDDENSSIPMADVSRIANNNAVPTICQRNEETTQDLVINEKIPSSQINLDDSSTSVIQVHSVSKICPETQFSVTENAQILGTLVNRRNNRKKTSVSIPITPDKVIVSTASSRYSVGTRRKTPYKLEMDVTMVFHIDEEWKIWKIESCSHGEIKFKPN